MSSTTKLSNQVTFNAPSNIAIVKYWGKIGVQEPINPSISFTLKNSFTTTSVTYLPKTENKQIEAKFLFEEKENRQFATRVIQYLESVKEEIPFITRFQLLIESKNSFPHSSGIASSASSMAALALCLTDIQKTLNNSTSINYQHASHLARLGSGSGCRSIKGKWNLWGKTPLQANSSNLYAVEIEAIAPIFNTLCDTILIIDPEKKKTSSTAGHSLMNDHPFKAGRIVQANQNIKTLLATLASGDFDKFIEITENEALTLHGLMLSSNPSYTLLLPNTLVAIQKIRDFREQTHLPLCFTLDAGPNIHLIYPSEVSDQIVPFIETELLSLCFQKKAIFDIIGNGATQIKL